MCISVFTTSHPDYPFILISNRDEFLARPTLRADWWDPPNQHVLGGRDLQRDERGTWLGITRQGRVAILTNFREQGDYAINREKSRGAMMNSYLCIPASSDESEEEFAHRLMRDVGFHDVGGFTMVFGRLRKPRGGRQRARSSPEGESMPGLALISNRTENPQKLKRIGRSTHETHGVSNSHYGDRSWPKVVHGEQYLDEAIANSSAQTKDELLASLFSILCSDSLPRRRNSETWDLYVRHMRNSIMIPPAKGQATAHHSADELRAADENLEHDQASREPGKGAYGTSKQTVILVDWEGRVTFVERTLFEGEGKPVAEEQRDVQFEFEIEGWDDDRSDER